MLGVVGSGSIGLGILRDTGKSKRLLMVGLKFCSELQPFRPYIVVGRMLAN